jgi:hypothetical protein
MPLSYAELEEFYKGLVSKARARGVTCAITSGMACVAFGVAEATGDCDLLCSPDEAGTFFKLLTTTALNGALPSYRGNLTAPLDSRWLRGGWTSHFLWPCVDGAAFLDIFGVAPRATSLWETEFQGPYAGLQTVAEMKRTDREKDWPYATALGLKLLEGGDQRGWLHLFNSSVLVETSEKLRCPPEMIALRPALSLLDEDEERLELALKAEVEFWRRLDHLRINIFERAARHYLAAVRRDARAHVSSSLETQHEARLQHAEQLLPASPLRDYGIDRLIDEAKAKAARMLPEGALRWLPDVAASFTFLPK